MLKKFFGVFVFTLLLTTLASRAQVVALKSDVLNWAAASLNIEPEVKVGKRSTIALGISWNPWTVKEDTKNRKWKHLLVQPEYRYWFCEAFGGHSSAFIRFMHVSMPATSSCPSASGTDCRTTAIRAISSGRASAMATTGY